MSYHVAYCGQGGTGKTFAAQAISRQAWLSQRRRSIVFDPNGAAWGPQAIVFTGDQLAAFWEFAWAQKNCLVFVDEVVTSMPRDKEANAAFTRIRHRGHQLHMLLHEAANLLPMQRGQLGTLFLFNQHPSSAERWATEWNDERMLEATRLPKREFIYCRHGAGQPPHLHAVTRTSIT